MQSSLYRKMKYTKVFKYIRAFQRKKNQQKIRDTISPSSTASEYQKLLNYYTDMMKCIDLIHANSEIALSAYKKNYADCEYKMIPITHAGLKCCALKMIRRQRLILASLEELIHSKELMYC